MHNAWLRTIEDGVHTYDIFTEGVSTQKVGTKEFAAAVVARLGQKPNRLKPVTYAKRPEGTDAGPAAHQLTADNTKMELKGIDVFVYWPSRNPNALAEVDGQVCRRRSEPADDRQPRREGVAGRPRGDLLHGQFPLPLHGRGHRRYGGVSRACCKQRGCRRYRDRCHAVAAHFRRPGRASPWRRGNNDERTRRWWR